MLTDIIQNIAAKVNDLDNLQVEEELKKVTNQQILKVNSIAQDFCYDRYVCDLLKIPYERINHDDYNKVRLAAYYLIQHKPEFKNYEQWTFWE